MTKKQKFKPLIYVEYVVKDTPIMGRKVVRHYIEQVKNNSNYKDK